MGLQDVSIKVEYRTLVDNITRDFYIPLLKEANLYKRAVGFFSSSSLVEISKGIEGLINNGGKILLVATPKLSEDDIKAIQTGYELKEEILKQSILRELKQPKTPFHEKRLNLLANLIADGILDIHIVITSKNSKWGMFHEKVGILYDAHGNRVAFSGSMNETRNAMLDNYETVDVFCDWKNSDNFERVDNKEKAFDDIWFGREATVKTYEFPQLSDEIIRRYKISKVDYEDIRLETPKESEEIKRNIFFEIPDCLELYDYQKEAIEKWFKRACIGYYDMATGAGKTYTALASIAKLSQSLNENLAVVIVVPYQHLVEQWVEDINQFGVTPIIAYSYSGQHWREEFLDAVNAYNVGAIDNFCIITTTATFSTDDFQNTLNRFKRNFCFVADEAHNLGAERVNRLLPKRACYRLALSATIERHQDEAGTKALFEYFGKRPCISFTLAEAISRGYLTPYYYYPVIVTLNADELDEYKEISRKLLNYLKSDNDGSTRVEFDNPAVKALLLKRARIVAGCRSKVDRLIEAIRPYKNDSNILVYCGATKYDKKTDDIDQKQITEVNQRLYSELNMKVHKFTSEEDIKDRAIIKQMFVNRDIQVITAIKCLDEGVNIPAIKTAFILASSTNPKEYIQRRGRVLRKAIGKEYAEIFDFITLPRPLNEVETCNKEELAFDYSLIKRERERMMDFAASSRNPLEIDNLLEQIDTVYSHMNIGGIEYEQ